MAGGSYIKADIQCPFYRYDDGGLRVACEGLVDDSVIILRFKRRRDWEIQVRTFCCDHFDKCEICRMIMENKYEEEDL